MQYSTLGHLALHSAPPGRNNTIARRVPHALTSATAKQAVVWGALQNRGLYVPLRWFCQFNESSAKHSIPSQKHEPPTFCGSGPDQDAQQ